MGGSAWRFWVQPGQRSGDPALHDAESGQWLSYGQLHEVVAQLAARLVAGRKQLVVVLCRNDLATVIGYLASLEAGHAVALLDAGLDATLFASLDEAYQPDLLLGGASALAGYDPPLRPHPCGPVVRRRRAPASGEVHAELGLLLPTSGTTGSPRFARLSYRGVAANASAIAAALGLTPGDRAITSLPLHYSYGLSLLHSHLHAGASLVLTPAPLVSQEFWDALRRLRCTSFAGVPYSYQVLRRLDLRALDVPDLSVMTQAGGRLADPLVLEFHQRMAERGGKFFVMYGQTEATARISVLPWNRLPANVGSVGFPIPGGRLEIETDGARTREPEVTGEVVYTGPNVMLGYAHGRGDLSRGDELCGCLHTGDLGRFDQEGLLYVTGRSTRIAKIYGLRVNLDEVEALVRRHGAVAALGVEDRLVIFCEFGDATEFRRHAGELSRLLRVHHGAFDFRRVPQLPLMASGKVDYRALQAGL